MKTACLRWGILGTGHIARRFAQGITQSSTGRLVAVGSRSLATADRFAGEFGASRSHATYESLLSDPEVQIVYVATPHPTHAEWTIRAAEAGKHILCEKPLAMNVRDAAAMIEAARANGVFLMEAFIYRCHPQTYRLIELLQTGAIGTVRTLQATFSYRAPPRPAQRLFDPALGGGGILDVGCYTVSIARLIAGIATGRAFAEPDDFHAVGRIGNESGVDEWSTAIAAFPHGAQAQLATGITVHQDNSVRLYGSEGWVHVGSPWQPAKFGGEWSFQLHRNGSEAAETVSGVEPRSIYTVEADHVADQISRGHAESSAMSWQDSIGNMNLLDRWRSVISLGHPVD